LRGSKVFFLARPRESKVSLIPIPFGSRTPQKTDSESTNSPSSATRGTKGEVFLNVNQLEEPDKNGHLNFILQNPGCHRIRNENGVLKIPSFVCPLGKKGPRLRGSKVFFLARPRESKVSLIPIPFGSRTPQKTDSESTNSPSSATRGTKGEVFLNVNQLKKPDKNGHLNSILQNPGCHRMRNESGVLKNSFIRLSFRKEGAPLAGE
jgi:hypothetical protein